MEIDNTLINKLKYIDNHQKIIKSPEKKIISKEQINDFFFTNIKGKDYKLLKQFNTKFLAESKSKKNCFKDKKQLLDFACFQQMQKKLNLIQTYFNLAGLVVLLRYLDMIVIVKRGGIFFKNLISLLIFCLLLKNIGLYFSLISCYLFYNLNRYYSKYKNCEIFNYIAKINNNTPLKLLEKIKKENNEKYKDHILTNNALNKYWKEPMAWH